MKKKRTGLCILITLSVLLVLGLGLFILSTFEPEPERVNKKVYEEIGETIRIEKLVSIEGYKSATISPEIIMVDGYSDAEVGDNGQSVFVGNTVSTFDVIVYVTDAEGKVTEERVTVVPGVRD